MKTPIQQLLGFIEKKHEGILLLSDLTKEAEKLLNEEKSQLVRAFNSGMRDENDNGYDYYNQWYNDRV